MSTFEIFDLPQDDQKKHVYLCSICQGEFKDAFARDEHERKNLWRISFEKVEGDIDHINCKQCGKVFITEEDSSFEIVSALSKFKSHFTGTGSHCGRDVYLKWRFPPPKERKGKWTVHPIHEKLVKKHIKKDKEKSVLRHHRNVTYLIIKALEYGFKEDAWNTLQIVGPTGHGKSAAGIFLGQWMCDYVEDHPDMFKDFYGRPELHITHSLFETADKFRTAKPYSTILQDESPNIQGRGQKWFSAALATLMDTMRAARVNLIFCTPNVLEELKTIQFIIEIYARWKTEKRTWGYLYDAERTALGECFFDVSTTLNSAEYKEYVKRKMANIAALKMSGGSLSAQVSEERRNDDIDRVVRAVLSSEMIPEDQLPKISLERVMGAATYVVDGIESYQKEVAYYAQHMIHQQFKPSPEEAREARVNRFSVESECKQQMEAEFYKFVIERECNSKATVRYASELFDWEKYRGHLFEKGSNWERVCRVIVDVVMERCLGELDEDEDTGEPDSEPVPQRRQGVEYIWEEYQEMSNDIEVLRLMLEIGATSKKVPQQQRWGACYGKHRILMGQLSEDAAKDAKKELKLNKSLTMFYRPRKTKKADGYKQSAGYWPQFISGKLGWCGEKAIQQLFFSDYEHRGGQHEPDLWHKSNPPCEIKWRDIRRLPTTQSGEDHLFTHQDSDYLNNIVANGDPLLLVTVYYSERGVEVRFYRLKYL